MASTILAVDDSVTMRKVLEITFTGLEFRCVTVPGPDAALEKVKTEKPALVIADLSLEGKNGYDLCKAVKQASPTTPVLILSSKHNPYDPAKGTAAGADDHIDKPYDTQSMIDKVRKLLSAPAKEAPKPAAQPVATPTPAAKPAAQPVAAPTAVATMSAASPTPAPPGRAKTLVYNSGAPMPGTPAATPAKPEPAPSPKAAPVPTPAGGVPAQPRAGTAVAAQVNGQMAGKLEEMGLNAQQIEAILQLSREVVERVVWEVVPGLAETIIREEIARLTK